ncbi:MAG: hypothetical protein ACLVKA_00285 [Collinsella aerofaciens]
MNDINAAQRKRAAAQELAEADRIKRVTEATAEPRRWKRQAKASPTSARPSRWASGTLEIIQETGVGNDEANQLFMFTQWSEMMTEFARTGKLDGRVAERLFAVGLDVRADAGRRQSSKRFEGVDAREIHRRLRR